ncbi:MAG: M24 family metallopeptidase, partial [Myxococcales bacterium]|nr:M24 family metallopeptidase [Myxococcales bacterium]
RDYTGHGIGRRMHQPPSVPHVGLGTEGPRLFEGACFTIEPMICLGRPEVVHDRDGWTVRTSDGRLSAQFEHTICVTEDGVEVLTVVDERGAA